MTTTIFKIILAIHIICGTFGLLAGSIALFIDKTKKGHKLAGKFFLFSVLGIFLTSIYMCIVHANIFLLLVGFFSFYLAATGYRILSLKKLGIADIKPKAVDYLIIGTGIITGIAIIILSIYLFIDGNSYGIVCFSFGLVSMWLGYRDAIKFKFQPTERTHWIKSHSARMAGAYTATVTAFIVVNVNMNNGWILWILPACIIVPITNRISKKFIDKN